MLDDPAIHRAHVSVIHARLYHPVHKVQRIRARQKILKLGIQGLVSATGTLVNSGQDRRQILFHRQDLVIGHACLDLILPAFQVVQDVVDRLVLQGHQIHPLEVGVEVE